MRRNKIDLGIVTTEPFPVGLAATNRMISYLKALKENNIDIKVYITKPTEQVDNIYNLQHKGNYQGIEFEYIHGYTVWPKQKSKVKKIMILLNGVILLYKELNKDNPKSIILVSNYYYLIISLWLISKKIGFKYFQEKSEYPGVVKNKVNFFYKRLYLSAYKFFDGIIVMTNELKKYYNGIGQKNIFHLPMTVSYELFAEAKTNQSKQKYFAYCGGGNYKRDGVLEIIKAFIEVAKVDSYYELHIIGPKAEHSAYYQKMVQEAKKYKISDRIKFLGLKRSIEIPKLISDAECLVMAPPKNFNSGGFPTKLGEYLATGNPVICTYVSEIPNYLDEKSALLIEPANHSQLVVAMKRIINNEGNLKEIGLQGQRIAKQYFSINSYIKEFIAFLEIS